MTVPVHSLQEEPVGQTRPNGYFKVGTVTAETVNDRVKLLTHRLIARRLKIDPDIVLRVREGLRSQGGTAPDFVREWMSLLDKDVDTVRRKITERSPDMDRLRISSPFVGVLALNDPDLRRRMYRKAELGLRSPVPGVMTLAIDSGRLDGARADGADRPSAQHL